MDPYPPPPRDRVGIRALWVDCIIGVYPEERCKTQPLCVDLDLFLSTEEAATREDLALTLDYASVARLLRFVLREGRFLLLESAAHTLAKLLLMPPAGRKTSLIQSCRIEIHKPEALGDGGGVPSVEIFRSVDWLQLDCTTHPSGELYRVHEGREFELRRLDLAPGCSVRWGELLPPARVALVLSPILSCAHGSYSEGSRLELPSMDWMLENRSEDWQSLLWISDRPGME